MALRSILMAIPRAILPLQLFLRKISLFFIPSFKTIDQPDELPAFDGEECLWWD